VKPAASTHGSTVTEHESDGRQGIDKRSKACWPSREYKVRSDSVGLASTVEAATGLDVGCWVEIAAEWRRVFSAVSIPEYIETWIELGDGTALNHWIPLGPQDMLCIQRMPTTRVVRIYRMKIRTRRNRLTFLWESIEPHIVHPSTVEIVIKGRPRRCTLRLRHSGLRNWNERQLYSVVWRRSLDRLQSLLR
jgi:hypothetical protein